jgi:hypothetical protein
MNQEPSTSNRSHNLEINHILSSFPVGADVKKWNSGANVCDPIRSTIEIATPRNNLMVIMSCGHLRVISTAQTIDPMRKLKINSRKWKFTLYDDITQEKQDVRESH